MRESVPLTLPQLLERVAALLPRRTALDFLGQKLSYVQLYAQVQRCAAALQRLGLQPGERVALLLPNSPPFVVAFFAALLAGAVAVPLSPLQSAPEMRRALLDSEAALLLTLPELLPRYLEAQPTPAVRQVVLADLADSLPFPQNVLWRLRKRGQPAASSLRFTDLLRGAPTFCPVHLKPDDLATLQYTGGTTGAPKGAMLSHANLVSDCQQAAQALPLLRFGQETVLGAIPLFHAYGLTAALNVSVLMGATLVLLPDARDIRGLLRAMKRSRATLLPGVPTLLSAIVHAAPRRAQLRSLRACISGGAPLLPQTAQDLAALCGASVLEGYGLSEGGPITHMNKPGQARLGSIGQPLPQVLASVRNEAGRPVARGEVGELWVSGPNVMLGYWRNPEETRIALREEGGRRWLLTGDLATTDSEGFFYIVGRKKDLILVSGFNVYPREVEEVLCQHPAVQEVAVIGVPHPRQGEAVRAFVVFRPGHSATEAELRRFARQRLSPYKVPRSVEVLEQLPKSAVGKVLRRALEKTPPA